MNEVNIYNNLGSNRDSNQGPLSGLRQPRILFELCDSGLYAAKLFLSHLPFPLFCVVYSVTSKNCQMSIKVAQK